MDMSGHLLSFFPSQVVIAPFPAKVASAAVRSASAPVAHVQYQQCIWFAWRGPRSCLVSNSLLWRPGGGPAGATSDTGDATHAF